jgi:hypothetical protein
MRPVNRRSSNLYAFEPQLCSAKKEESVTDANADCNMKYRGADKSLDRPWRKQATATENFEVHVSYL